MALAYSKGMPVDTPAPAFELPGTDGKTHSLESFAEAKALVVIFTCNHCPYAQAVEARLLDLQRDYESKGVQLVAISSNDADKYPEDSFERMRERAEAKSYNFPYLYDESQDVARQYDAACTPDVFVFDAERRLRYNGRIDDNWKDPSGVTRQDLRQALNCVLSGERLGFEPIPSMGCSIKWR